MNKTPEPPGRACANSDDAYAYVTNMETVDILEQLDLYGVAEGIIRTSGICRVRKDSEQGDISYRLRNVQLSAPTRQLYPSGTFPRDFSVMTTVRATRRLQAFLLSMYSQQGVQQLGVELARSPVFLYEDHTGHPLPEEYPIFKRVNLANGKWHRIGLSIKGQHVTLILDCKETMVLPLPRSDEPWIDPNGITVFGTRMTDNATFEGDIQQLLIVSDPRAAFDYCTNYMPDCETPLPEVSWNRDPMTTQHYEAEIHEETIFNGMENERKHEYEADDNTKKEVQDENGETVFELKDNAQRSSEVFYEEYAAGEEDVYKQDYEDHGVNSHLDHEYDLLEGEMHEQMSNMSDLWPAVPVLTDYNHWNPRALNGEKGQKGEAAVAEPVFLRHIPTVSLFNPIT
uniref:collagen alpha-1(XI) chain-like n=1 Tax=Myxine glutinosa TaxID=7769 RepID=UPI00358EBC08